MLTAPSRLHLRHEARASSDRHARPFVSRGGSVGAVAPILMQGARRAWALQCSKEDGHSGAAQRSPAHQSTMGEVPDWEPGQPVIVQIGAEVRRGVLVSFMPPGQLVVELRPQEVKDPRACSEQQEQRALSWKPFLCNIAGTIVLHAWNGSRAGRRRAGESHQPPPSDHFSKLAEAGDRRLRQVAGSMGVDLVQLGTEADALLARQEGYSVLETLEDLELSVENVRYWIAPYMEVLEWMCPWECRILQAYEDFKRAFPKGFR